MADSPIELPIAPKVVYLSYCVYCLIFFVGMLQPRKFEEVIQVIGSFVFSIIGGIDNRLLYSLTLLFIFTLLEVVRNFPAFRYLMSNPNDLSRTKFIRSGLFPLLIILYFIASVFSVMRSTESMVGWQPIPDFTTFLIDFISIWAVSYSIVNIFYLFLVTVSSRIIRS
jgi:hypothetical protein